MMPGKLILTVVSLHLTVALLIALDVLLPLRDAQTNELAGSYAVNFGPYWAWRIAMPGIAVSLIVVFALELVVWGLSRLSYSSWLAGLIVSGILVISGIFAFGIPTIIGAVSLWGLLDRHTVQAFRPSLTR